MLTQKEIYAEAIRLPYEERDDLVNELKKTLGNNSEASRKPMLTRNERKSIVDTLRGALANRKSAFPSDEEILADHVEHLLEKHK